MLKRCGLDAYFFLRYLRTLLVIFVPIAFVVIPILVPLNYMSGLGDGVVDGDDNSGDGVPTGLDTLTWVNIDDKNINRYWAHLLLAICVIVWVCVVFFLEMRVYIKIRQDYLTSAEHRLRASATTVLINNVPPKWLSESALRGLLDVFPGGIRNVWLNRDLTSLLEKIELRDSIHRQLEAAETDLIKMAKKKQLKMRKKEEKKSRRSNHAKGPTKEELERRRKQEDAEARRLAESGQGTAAGAHDDAPQDVSQVVENVQEEERQRRLSRQVTPEDETNNNKGFGLGVLGEGISKFGQGIGRFGQGVESGVATTNGFTRITSASGDAQRATTPQARPSADHRRVHAVREQDSRLGGIVSEDSKAEGNDALHIRGHSRQDSVLSQNSWQANSARYETTANGNTIRKVSDLKIMYDNEQRKWYQFWKPPAGGYMSPIPQTSEDDEFPFTHKPTKKTLGQKLLYLIGLGSDELPPLDYEKSTYTGTDYDEERDKDALWRQYLKPKQRPTHRLPRWGFPNWLAWLTFGKKVDTIYWCRTELARLNLEIRTDQTHPERYPLMNSAFVQFNEQVSAHMACQSLMHHLPKQMAPRINEVSPRDVIWSNMSIKWWDEWARTAAVTLLIVTMIIFWALPVAATAALGNIDELAALPGLAWLKNSKGTAKEIALSITGILPPAMLALLLVLVPIILDLLAGFKGSKTGAQKTEFVQKFFFAFLFVQVFLVVTIATFFTTSVPSFINNLTGLTNITSVLELLADNLPKSSNYFFSYMLLQGMSVSSGALLQIGTLIMWYVIARIIDSTARNKWQRNTQLNTVKWGHMFPIYTNFGCIALIYSIIAPLISIFAIITFSLLWVAQKYCLVYVVRAGVDTGGVLYQRAINQLFTGLYVMELCLTGLFLLKVKADRPGSTARAAIMVVCLLLTILYQSLLNRHFSPLARYLPITIEDEAAIRDRVFEEEQRQRFGLADDTEVDADEEKAANLSIDGHTYAEREDDEIELRGMRKPAKNNTFNPMRDVTRLAKRGGKGLRDLTLNKVEGAAPVKSAAAFRKAQRRKDLEAQRAIGDALYGGVADEIEDLMPEERNALIIDAFKHHALRARQPTVWIPHDDIGISEDEIRLTREYTENVHISNEGTALDSKVRVVYGLNPPDFSEVDLIDL